MKKSTLFLLGSFIGVSALAAPVQLQGNVRPMSHEVPQMANFSTMPSIENLNLTFDRAQMQASRSSEDIILNPEGQHKYYEFLSNGIYMYYYYGQNGLDLYQTSSDTFGADIVWGEDNKVYLGNVIASCPFGYLEGELSADGKTITVTLPQEVVTLHTSDGTEIPGYFSIGNLSESDGYNDYIAETDPTKLTLEYTIDDKGVISMAIQDGFEGDASGKLIWPEKALCLFIDMGSGMQWYYDMTITGYYMPTGQTPVIERLPEAAESEEFFQQWALTDPVQGISSSRFAAVGIDSYDFYIGYISDMAPYAILNGQLEDGKVSFESGTLLGMEVIDPGYYGYWGGFPYLEYGVTGVWTLEEDEDGEYYAPYLSKNPFVMNYDAEKNELTTVEEMQGPLVINSIYTTNGKMFAGFIEPVIRMQEESELLADPQSPWIEETYFSDTYKCYGAAFYFPSALVNGAVISPAELSYRVYCDGEIFIFDASDYELEEDLEEIPTTFSNTTQDILGYGDYAIVYIYATGIETIGVQAIYTDPEGVKHYSNITECAASEGSGLQTINPLAPVTSVQYFDLTGRRVSNPAAGSLVIRVSRMADGSVKADKVIF